MTRSPYGPDPVVVELQGSFVHVPHRCAAEWIAAASDTTGPSGILMPLARPTTRETIRESLALRTLTYEELTEASYALMTEAIPGFSWWQAYRLLMLSNDHLVVGRATLSGLDPWALTVTQWVSAVYVMLKQNTSDKDQFKFDAALDEVPEGVEADSDWGDMSFDQMVANARSTPGMS